MVVTHMQPLSVLKVLSQDHGVPEVRGPEELASCDLALLEIKRTQQDLLSRRDNFLDLELPHQSSRMAVEPDNEKRIYLEDIKCGKLRPSMKTNILIQNVELGKVCSGMCKAGVGGSSQSLLSLTTSMAGCSPRRRPFKTPLPNVSSA